MTIRYRPEIDGLRAVAVVPVIFYHAGFDLFSGGYVGVDVFFVISGYLITSLIIADLQTGTFSLPEFYLRRARRILPALFTVIIVSVPFAWMWMPPAELHEFGRSVMAVSLFASNFLFWLQSGYFGPATDTLPLIHTWSLAVEEQYYLLYPLILMMVWSRGFRAVLLTIGTMLCLSFLASVWGTNHFPDATFYLLPMRAWELFVGGFCAFVLLRKANKLQSWNQLTAVCGLLLILLSVFWFDDATPFPGLAALLPTLGTAAIIVSATPATFVGRALRFSPIVALGLISYSAYLWHQPLFAFARIRLLQVPTPWQFLLLSVMTLALAWLSWRFIETPFRNRTKIVTNTVIRSALIAATVLLALGITLDTRTELPFRAEFIQLESTLSDNDCQGSRINYVSPEQACIHNAGLPLSVALWGDSHAMALTTALSTSLATVNTAFTEFTYQGCPPVPGLRRIDRPDECARFNGEVLDYLLVNSQIRSVILVARWPLYLEGSGFDNREGGSESMGRNNTLMALPLDVSDAYAENPERVAVVLAIIRANIIALMDAGKQVILVDPIPEAGWHVSALLAREQLNDVVRIAPLSTSFAVYQERNQLILELFDSLSAETDLIRIRPQELLCQSLLPQRCVNQWNGEALYIDSNHLNQKGAMMVTELIVSSM